MAPWHEFIDGGTVAITVISFVIYMSLRSISRPRHFPPGPRGVPFLGSIFSMTASPEEVFARWSKKYGDVFGFKVGERFIVVINRQEAIKEAVVKHGLEFAGRPDFYSFGVFTYGFKDIIFSTISETWKLHHKLARTALREFATVSRLESLLHGAFPKLEKVLAEQEGKPVDPKLMITLLLYNVMSTMCFGRDFDLLDETLIEWKESNERLNEEFGLGVAADFFKWARFLPTSGVKMVDRMRDEFHRFVWSELDSHKRDFEPGNVRDFFDMLLQAQGEAEDDEENSKAEKLSDTHLVLTVSNMFAAGIQTTTETLYWAIALVVEHPEIQAKVQVEIESVIGLDRVPVIADRGRLPYTEATLYEVLRFSTILPIAVPHATTCDVKFRGFHIPKGAVVMLNIHSAHYDVKAWDNPNSFNPEHFLENDGSLRQHPPSFIPFGAGRRACLGETVAKADLFLIFTWFMQNYTFSKLSGKDDVDLLKVIENSAVGRNLMNFEIACEKRT